MATVVNQTMSDAQLIGASRTGGADAYAELYRRHVDAARAVARALCRNRSDADDVVSEAFAKLLRILQEGNGPELAFRPYLLVAVRNCFYDKFRRKRELPIDHPTEEIDLALIDKAGSEDNKALAAAAFATLPERWQLVLWHTEVEGQTSAEVAPLLGMAPNAVAALAYRAREGLRQAFLQAHLRTPRPSDCRECVGSLGAYVRDGLSARDRRRVDEHLAGCDSCKALLIELTDTNTTLRAALIPMIAGVPVAAYLSGLGGKGLLAWFGRLPLRQQVGVGAGASAGAAAAVAVAITAIVPSGVDTANMAALTTLQPRAAVAAVDQRTTNAATDPPTITITNTTSTTTPAPPTAPSTSTPSRVVATWVEPTTISATVSPTMVAATTVVPSTTTPAPAAPTTAALATAAPTTTVVIVPRLVLTSVQVGVALLGGQVSVQLDVSAAVLPTNGFRINAYSNLVVSVPLPAGMTLAATDNPAWSCTPQGVCTISSLASGSKSTAVLTFDLSLTVISVISFAPTVTSPAGAVVQSQPITIIALLG